MVEDRRNYQITSNQLHEVSFRSNERFVKIRLDFDHDAQLTDFFVHDNLDQIHFD
jgi:hypothetical protein